MHELEGAQVVVAEIPELEPGAKPCFYRGAGMAQGSYVRVGDGDQRMTSYEVQLVLANRGQPRWDEEPVPGTSLDDLSPALVDALVGRLRVRRPYAFGDVDTVAALRLLKALMPDAQGRTVASIAGLLALGIFPQTHFPQLMLSFVHYPRPEGADLATGERFIDNVVVEGPIPIMVRDALLALHKNMTRRSFVRGVGREDVWEYPSEALREIVVNALVHRDLSAEARGAQVQIAMYPDRLVVSNPGGLYGPVTIDRLGEDGVTSARNATLLRILEDVPVPGTDRPVCENRGTGIRTVIAALRSARMSPPEFADRISRFTVTFPNHTLLAEDVVRWIESLGQSGLSETQCVGLALLKEGDFLDNQAYRTHTGVDSRIATAELRDLVDRGLVAQVGTRRWARYELRQGGRQIAILAGPARADRRPTILEALHAAEATAAERQTVQIPGLTTVPAGELTRSQLSEATGLSDSSLRHWLRILRQEGEVELIGKSRSPHARYRRVRKSAT